MKFLEPIVTVTALLSGFDLMAAPPLPSSAVVSDPESELPSSSSSPQAAKASVDSNSSMAIKPANQRLDFMSWLPS